MVEAKKESFVGKVISRGRVTIPGEIRILLNIKDGDLVRITVEKINQKQEEVVEVEG